jgi:hypothetical protein
VQLDKDLISKCGVPGTNKLTREIADQWSEVINNIDFKIDLLGYLDSGQETTYSTMKNCRLYRHHSSEGGKVS